MITTIVRAPPDPCNAQDVAMRLLHLATAQTEILIAAVPLRKLRTL